EIARFRRPRDDQHHRLPAQALERLHFAHAGEGEIGREADHSRRRLFGESGGGQQGTDTERRKSEEETAHGKNDDQTLRMSASFAVTASSIFFVKPSVSF